MTRILLVNRDRRYLASLAAKLQPCGFEVIVGESGEAALRLTYQERPELVMTGLDLPGMGGIELCQRLREMTDIPILVLSPVNTVHTIVDALEAGADDYITKPEQTAELVARIRAKLKARARAYHAAGTASILKVGALQIDTVQRKVWVRGEDVDLTATEYALLLCLARHQNQVVDHRKLLSDAWGPEHADQLTYLHTYVHALRRKVEADPARPQLIKTSRGAGYYLAA